MITAALCGAGVGAGLWLAARGLHPPRPHLTTALRRLRTPPPPPPSQTTADGEAGVAVRLGGPVARLLAAHGLDGLIPARITADLAVLGRSREHHLGEKVFLAGVGILFTPALTAVLAMGGITLGVAVPLWAGLILGVGGFFAPDVGVHHDAEQRRCEFRHALSVYLDLVTVSLAGGAGVETALHDAARVGEGWAFEQLRHALDTAQLHRQAPWASLAQLGADLAISDLQELAASVSLAGTEGARVRASLATKAASLRTHELTDAEAAAEAASERMSLPVVVLFAGFLTFIAFPAIARVLTIT